MTVAGRRSPERDRAAARRGGGTIRTEILPRAVRRGALLVPLVWLLGTLLVAGLAGAQPGEPPAGGAEHGAAPAEHSTAAESHPSIMNVEPGLTVWTIVTFVALLVALRFTAWKPLVASLEARERRIREAVEGAERARKDSEALLARHQEMLEQAKADAHAIIEEGKADGLRLRDSLTAQAHAEAEEFKARARRELELATDQAKKELFVHAANLSVSLAERILSRSLDTEDQRRIVDRVVAEYRAQQSN
jgi:F-type H+-transporting ATPase subunit b